MVEKETFDSGERIEYSTGMVRDTEEGKPNFFLLIPKDIPYSEQFMTRCAALLTRGSKKYAARNWEQASTEEEEERFKSSAYRHFMQWINGEEDEDHAAAVFFGLMGAEYVKYKRELNERND